MHASLAPLPPVELPTLAAFPPHAALADVASRLGVPPEELVDPAGLDIQSRRQLVHGDFSSANMRLADGRVRIFDFDDCGHGPVELDLALSLYMVLFDAMTRTDPDLYPRFRSAFLAGFRAHSDVALSDRTLDQLVTYRVAVLGSWLAQPETASLGVRTSSEEWRAALHRFVQQYIASEFPGPR